MCDKAFVTEDKLPEIQDTSGIYGYSTYVLVYDPDGWVDVAQLARLKDGVNKWYLSGIDEFSSLPDYPYWRYIQDKEGKLIT